MEDLFKVTGEVTLKKGGGRELKAGGMWIYVAVAKCIDSSHS